MLSLDEMQKVFDNGGTVLLADNRLISKIEDLGSSVSQDYPAQNDQSNIGQMVQTLAIDVNNQGTQINQINQTVQTNSVTMDLVVLFENRLEVTPNEFAS